MESPWLKIIFLKVMFLSNCPHPMTHHHWAIKAWPPCPNSESLWRAILASEFSGGLAKLLVRLRQSPVTPLPKAASCPSLPQVMTTKTFPNKLPVHQSPPQNQVSGDFNSWHLTKSRLESPCEMAQWHRLKLPQTQMLSHKSRINTAIKLPLAMWPFQTYYTRIKKNNSNNKTLISEIIRVTIYSIWKNWRKHREKNLS